MKQPIRILMINLISLFAVTTVLTSNAQAGLFSSASVDISAHPTTISAGQQTALTWTSEQAWGAEIDNGVGEVDLNGSIAVSPTQTTTYEITVRGDCLVYFAEIQTR